MKISLLALGLLLITSSFATAMEGGISPMHRRALGLGGRTKHTALPMPAALVDQSLTKEVQSEDVAMDMPVISPVEIAPASMGTASPSLEDILINVETVHLTEFKQKTVPAILQEVSSEPDDIKRERKAQRRTLKAQKTVVDLIGEAQRNVIKGLESKNSLSKDEMDTWLARIEVSLSRSQANITHKLHVYSKKHKPASEDPLVDEYSKQHQDIESLVLDNGQPFIANLDHSYADSQSVSQELTIRQTLSNIAKEHKKAIASAVSGACITFGGALVYLIYRVNVD